MATTSSYAGGCRCGAIRFRVTGEARHRCFCHCDTCRRYAGASPVPWATFAADAFVLERGTLAWSQSSEHVARGFCAACGTRLTYQHAKRPEELDVAVLALDEPDALRPEYHIWVSDQLPWIRIDDGLPQYRGWRSDG